VDPPLPTRKTHSGLLALALLVAGGIVVLGSCQYRNLKAEARRSAIESISAIGGLQAGEIADWYHEREEDALEIKSTPLPAREFEAFLARPVEGPYRASLLAWMESKLHRDYESLSLYDAEGRLRLSVPSGVAEPSLESPDEVRRAAQSHAVQLLDLRLDAHTGRPYMTLLVPVGSQPAGRQPDPGVIALRIDPSHRLFPRIAVWPTPSPSAETLLLRREGGEVVFLNPPRHGSHRPLTPRIPMDAFPQLPSVRAVSGQVGVAETLDYRGVAVFAAYRNVPGTPWSLVAKVDSKEVYSHLRAQTRDLMLVLGALVLTGASGVSLVWHRRNLAWAQQDLAQEHRRLEVEQKYRAFFDQAAVGVAEVDSRSGAFLSVNRRYGDLLGYPESELTGLSIQDVTHPDDLPAQLEAMDRLRAGEIPDFTLEKRYHRKDGSLLWGAVTVSPLRRPGEELRSHVAVLQDITTRKVQEAQIQQLHRLYASLSRINQAIVRSETRDQLFGEVCRVLVESGGFGMAWFGVPNPATGFIEPVADHGDTAGYLKSIRVRSDDSPEGRGPTGTALREGRICVSNRFFEDPRTQPWREPARTSGWKSSLAVPLGVLGRVEAVLSVYSDREDRFGEKEVELLQEAARDLSFAVQNLDLASQRRRAEELARRTAAYSRSLIEASLDPLVTIDPAGRITDVNTATEEVTGRSRPELVGSDFADYFTQPAEARNGYQRVFKEGSVRDYPLEIQHRSGRITPVLYNACVYRNDAGDVEGVFAAARDITQLKEAQARLDHTVAELQRSNRELEQFAYVASHDLQEPLRSIASFTQLLLRRYGDRLDQDGREFAGFAVEGATRMQAMINDLLAYSRVGTRGNPFQAVDTRRVLEEVTQNLRAALEESGARVTLGDLPVVRGDGRQLAELFQNLLGNAIKFRGGRTPDIAVTAIPMTGGWLFSVQDNGIGIEHEFFDRIFTVFQKLHGHGEYPGSGIGLAICKKIVERHGGRIWVDSEFGKGSTFHFTIPDRGGEEP
jgi:PAS domain S-box-containing protein